MIDKARPATVRDFVEEYGLERGLRKSSLDNLRFKLNQFARTIGRESTWGDFDRMTINRAIAKALETCNPETVRNFRSALLSLWRGAVEAGYLESPPTRIRQIKVPAKAPRAWTLPELQKVLAIAGNLRGKVNGSSILRRNFWRAFILVAYFSGLRFADLRSLRWENISSRGTITVTMEKTGDLLRCQLPSDVQGALALIRPADISDSPLVFGGSMNACNLQRFFRKRIIKPAGVGGSIKTLRKTGASHVEAANPGSARGFLGHRSYSLCYRSYVDPNIVQHRKPTPPKLKWGGKDGAN